MSNDGQLSIRDRWAQHHVHNALLRTYTALNPDLAIPPEGLGPPPELQLPPPSSSAAAPRVCIIGAGAAGLFTALLFDYLNQNVPGFHVDYDIFEAQAEASQGGRGVGGRLYTYNFSTTSHDYYDVGAMRFPENPIMDRTFALFGYLGMQKVQTSPQNPSAPLGSLVPYFMQGVNEPWLFNDINQTGLYNTFAASAASNDPFCLNDAATDPILPAALQYAATPNSGGPGGVLQNAIKPYIDALQKDPENGWNLLMTIDKMSTTQFLAVDPPYPIPDQPYNPPFNYSSIEWLETFGGGTNWYDQAHSETVLEYLDFDYGPGTNWWCIEGGAQQLATRMFQKLATQTTTTFSTTVTGIDVSQPNQASIQIQGNWQGSYAGVFNSTPLGCMQQMDLTKANLFYGQKQAIRSLGYGASAKIGMKFSEPWWINWFGINEGGLGHSDLSIRTTVYPSYNRFDTNTAVLLCSYEWQQDAQRISTLISSSKDHATAVKDEAQLKELVLRDLARLHANQPGTMWDAETVYNKIAPLYMDHYAHDWYHDETSFGAFAFFRPQQFGSMWPYIIAPSPSLVMIGEHASNHHAWVVGALESAVHGVHGWLTQNNFAGAAEAASAMETWTAPTNENPFGGLPPFANEFQRKWQRALGVIHEGNFQENLAKAKATAK